MEIRQCGDAEADNGLIEIKEDVGSSRRGDAEEDNGLIEAKGGGDITKEQQQTPRRDVEIRGAQGTTLACLATGSP